MCNSRNPVRPRPVRPPFHVDTPFALLHFGDHGVLAAEAFGQLPLIQLGGFAHGHQLFAEGFVVGG
jgi:hypothetical protein